MTSKARNGARDRDRTRTRRPGRSDDEDESGEIDITPDRFSRAAEDRRWQAAQGLDDEGDE